MSDDEPTVPVHCPECETTSRIPLSDLAEKVERHNEQLHDGEDVAHIDEGIKNALADMVVEDMGLLDEE